MSERSANVPTMDDFNALKAQVDKQGQDIAALDARVDALEEGGSVVPPDKPASADGTTVVGTSGQIVDSRSRTFKLTGTAGAYRIDCDGHVTGGNVVRLYAKSGYCHQENSQHNWWYADKPGLVDSNDDWTACANPTGEVPPRPSGDVVPPQAAAVGYNTLTLGPDVTLNENWFAYPGANLRQNADGSLTDLGGVPNHYNAHVCSTHPIANGQIGGTAFGGGFYAEIEWTWTPPTTGYQNTDGWPSWWATTAEADSRYNVTRLPNEGNLEFDCAEYMNSGNSNEFNHGIIHWYGGSGALYSNNNAGMSGSAHHPPGVDPRQKYRIGWLWVPATANSKGYTKGYVNGQQVGNTYTWDKWGGGGVPGQPNCPPFSIQDAGHCQLIWGSGSKNPVTAYRIWVWQKDKSQNISR